MVCFYRQMRPINPPFRVRYSRLNRRSFWKDTLVWIYIRLSWSLTTPPETSWFICDDPWRGRGFVFPDFSTGQILGNAFCQFAVSNCFLVSQGKSNFEGFGWALKIITNWILPSAAIRRELFIWQRSVGLEVGDWWNFQIEFSSDLYFHVSMVFVKYSCLVISAAFTYICVSLFCWLCWIYLADQFSFYDTSYR